MRIKQLENLKLSKEVINALKEKLYLIYAQNFSKVGLLTNYKSEHENFLAKETKSLESDNVLWFSNCQWKINVVLSTNYLSKVLRPEIFIEIQT